MEANKFEVKSLSDLIKVFAGIAADFEAAMGVNAPTFQPNLTNRNMSRNRR